MSANRSSEVRVLETIRERDLAAGMTLRFLAALTGLPRRSARFALRRLVEEGEVVVTHDGWEDRYHAVR